MWILALLVLLTIVGLFAFPVVAVGVSAAEFSEADARLLDAQNSVRQLVVQVLGGLLLVLGAVNAWRGLKATQEQQRNERLVRAIDLLSTRLPSGAPDQAVHLGAVHALGRYMREDGRDQRSVVSVLTAYLRQECKVADRFDSDSSLAKQNLAYRNPAAYEALRVILSRPGHPDDYAVDLSGVDLRWTPFDIVALQGDPEVRLYLMSANMRGSRLSPEKMNGNVFYDDDTKWPDLLEVSALDRATKI